MPDRSEESEAANDEPNDQAIENQSHSFFGRLTAPRTSGAARFGGLADLNFPGYAAVYVTAARAVLDAVTSERALDRLARPCIYLQRHALELMIKDLGELALDIIESREALEHQREYTVPKPLLGHALVDLVTAASSAVDRAGWSFPDEITQLAREFDELEQGDETRLRYDRGMKGAFRDKPSFRLQVEAPVADWQRRLEAIAKSLTIRMVSTDGDQTLMEEMGSEHHGLSQQLYAAGLYD